LYAGAHRALKWSIVASAAAVGLVIAIWIWHGAYPEQLPAQGGTDLIDGAAGWGLLLGAPTSFAVLLVIELIEAAGTALPVGEPFGMALWLAVVPVNWALLAVCVVRLVGNGLAKKAAPRSV
jgi:hypothetical protein